MLNKPHTLGHFLLGTKGSFQQHKREYMLNTKQNPPGKAQGRRLSEKTLKTRPMRILFPSCLSFITLGKRFAFFKLIFPNLFISSPQVL